MNTRFDELNPMDYENNIEAFPDTYVDYFDRRKRKVLCISEGTDEVVYLLRRSQHFSTDTHIFMGDYDDFTYYLKPIVAGQLLEYGKEYTLVNTYLETDIEIGMLAIEGQPEIGSEYEDFHGFPAFLFEELEPVSYEDRKKHRDAWYDKLTEEYTLDDL